MERKLKHIIGGLTILTITVFTVAFASGQITTQETDPSAINITTDPVTNVKETEATFQAILTGFDNTDYDAAMIYWNYSEDSSLDQPGPVTIENTETQRSVFHPDLAPDTSYNVEAYAEPIVWDDPTLMDNYQEKLAASSFVGEYPAEFKPDLSQSYSQYSDTVDTDVQVTTDMAISRDGTKLLTLYSYYYGAGYTNTAYAYNLSTPWDLSTAVQDSSTSLGSSSNTLGGIHISPDGKKMGVSEPESNVQVYDLSESWDLSTASQTSSMTLDDFNPTGDGVFFTPSGNKMYLSEEFGEVRSYTMAEPWNLSTASETNTISTGSDAQGIAFSDDGSKMMLSDNSINSYDLSTPWDISSYSSASSLSISDTGGGVAVSSEGDRIFYSDNNVYGLER